MDWCSQRLEKGTGCPETEGHFVDCKNETDQQDQQVLLTGDPHLPIPPAQECTMYSPLIQS